MRVLLIDFYDSFTYNLAHYLESMELKLTVVRHDQLSREIVGQANAIVLSPGPGLPSEKEGLAALLQEFVGKKPILGVCLGMQALVEHLGGTLENQSEVRHGVSEKINIQHHQGLFKHLPTQIEVGLYHSWKVVCPPDWISAIFPLRPTPLHLLDNEHAHDGLIVKFATALGALGIWAVFSSFINVNDFTVEHTVFFVKFDN